MVKIDGTQIEMTRSDSLLVTIGITDIDGGEYVPVEGDSIRFAMSRKYKGKAGYELLINKQIPTDTLLLELLPEETASLPYGTYNYDIQITHVDDRVDTFLSSTITLTGEVE